MWDLLLSLSLCVIIFSSLKNGDSVIIHYDFLSLASRIFKQYPGHTFPYNESVRTGTVKLQNDIKAP